MKAIGIDIGTTTICAVLLEEETGALLDSRTLPNDTAVPTAEDRGWEHLQDPEKILGKCRTVLEEYLAEYADVASIGVTGQMHGILYVDENGKAISPLYTWQDRRGDLPCGETDGDEGRRDSDRRESYVDVLARKTGYPVAAGYGLATHFCHVRTQSVPEGAASLCTIPDYIAMSLAGVKRPLMHQSMAASLGLYDLEHFCFDEKALRSAGIDKAILPEVTRENRAVGFLDHPGYQRPIAVAAALGDNQASFLGSTGPGEKLLLNVGTGSQISVCTDHLVTGGEAECRPYLGETWLLAGSPLCGGYAYSLLKRFVEELFALDGTEPSHAVYDLLNAAARKVYEEGGAQAEADTRFNGSRKEPGITGSIQGLTAETFHPGQFALAILKGICEELYRYYEGFPQELKEHSSFVGSGNGIRMNPLLREICCERFGMEMKIPLYSEEAGYGAALFSLLASGRCGSVEEVFHNLPV